MSAPTYAGALALIERLAFSSRILYREDEAAAQPARVRRGRSKGSYLSNIWPALSSSPVARVPGWSQPGFS